MPRAHPQILGLIDAGLGRKEEALRQGRRAVELKPATPLIHHLKVLRFWDPLRGDPDFQKLWEEKQL
jgi:hypothetical protein